MFKNLLLALALLITGNVWATASVDHYVKAAGGNWSAATTWSATSSAGVDNLGAPAVTDNVIFDTGALGTLTVDGTTANCFCKSLTCQAAGNTMVCAAGKSFYVSGSVTLFANMSFTGTGIMEIYNANSTFTSNGVTIPGDLIVATGTNTFTLADDLNITGALIILTGISAKFAGAHNVTCGTLAFQYTNFTAAITVTLVSGQTLTINTGINGAINYFTGSAYVAQITIKATLTNSTKANINYKGSLAACICSGVTFTDIDASSGNPILNFNGGTLTRTVNIFNTDHGRFANQMGSSE